MPSHRQQPTLILVMLEMVADAVLVRFLVLGVSREVAQTSQKTHQIILVCQVGGNHGQPRRCRTYPVPYPNDIHFFGGPERVDFEHVGKQRRMFPAMGVPPVFQHGLGKLDRRVHPDFVHIGRALPASASAGDAPSQNGRKKDPSQSLHCISLLLRSSHSAHALTVSGNTPNLQTRILSILSSLSKHSRLHFRCTTGSPAIRERRRNGRAVALPPALAYRFQPL